MLHIFCKNFLYLFHPFYFKSCLMFPHFEGHRTRHLINNYITRTCKKKKPWTQHCHVTHSAKCRWIDKIWAFLANLNKLNLHGRCHININCWQIHYIYIGAMCYLKCTCDFFFHTTKRNQSTILWKRPILLITMLFF